MITHVSSNERGILHPSLAAFSKSASKPVDSLKLFQSIDDFVIVDTAFGPLRMSKTWSSLLLAAVVSFDFLALDSSRESSSVFSTLYF